MLALVPELGAHRPVVRDAGAPEPPLVRTSRRGGPSLVQRQRGAEVEGAGARADDLAEQTSRSGHSS